MISVEDAAKVCLVLRENDLEAAQEARERARGAKRTEAWLEGQIAAAFHHGSATGLKVAVSIFTGRPVEDDGEGTGGPVGAGVRDCGEDPQQRGGAAGAERGAGAASAEGESGSGQREGSSAGAVDDAPPYPDRGMGAGDSAGLGQ